MHCRQLCSKNEYQILLFIENSLLTNKIKWEFFQSVAVSLWLLHFDLNETSGEKNYISMLHAALNKSWKQHPTKRQFYGRLLPISPTIQVRHVEYCWQSKDNLISYVFLCTPKNGHTSIEQPAKTYIHQLFRDIECQLEDLLRAIADRNRWWERVKGICVVSMP